MKNIYEEDNILSGPYNLPPMTNCMKCRQIKQETWLNKALITTVTDLA